MSDASSQQPVPRASGSSLHTPAQNVGDGSGSASMGSHRSSASGAQIGDGQTVISARTPTPDLPYAGGIPSDSARMWEGEQLGQFVLEKFVGGGGMGIVFRAHDTTLDREVAVKVLSRDQSADEETLRRFRNEAQSAARLNHDNIARVFYVGEDRGVHYIVFEFIEGVNIRDLVAHEGPLPLNQALSYSYQIALALDHASQRSVIHRDIKPSNVLVTPDGKAKLVDMGLARLNQMAQATNDLTASGVTLGTFDYISPEQARDPRSADVRSDLYSLGCSFYFMLTGRPPFPEGTVLQKLLQHQGDAPPDPRAVRPELPLQVSRVLARLLAKNPAERYQQPLELIEELAVLGQTLGIPLGEAPPPRSALPAAGRPLTWQRHLPWLVPLVALFLVVAGLEIYGARTPAPQAPPWRVRTTDERAARPREQVPPVVEVPEVSPAAPAKSSSLPPEIPALPPTTSPSKSNSLPSANKSPADSESPLSTPPPSASADVRPDASSPSVSGSAGNSGGAPPGPFLEGLLDLMGRWQKEEVDSQGSGDPSSTSDELDLSGTDLASAASPDNPAPATGAILTVGDDSQPNNFMSLLAACNAAQDTDVIELHYDGRRTERPLTISNKKLTIRAGTGYRPILVFAPEPDKPFADSQMVSVSGGQLTVQGIHWEFDLPAKSPTERSLFEARHADLLDFENCTFTVRAQPPYYGGVAVFDIKASPGAGTIDMGDGARVSHVANIHLENCVVRGEAALLRNTDVQAVRLTWNDGLLAINDHLLVTEGNSLQPRQEARVEVELHQVTAMVGGGLVLMTNSSEEPYQVVVDVRCRDCVVATTGSAPLVEQRGAAGLEEFLARFDWSGSGVYFLGFDNFWQITNSAGPDGSKQFDFDAWLNHWQFTSRDQFTGDQAVAFAALPPAERPHHAHLLADYVLESSCAAARGDAGARLPFLPPLPTFANRSEPVGTSPRPMALPMPMPMPMDISD